MAHNRKKITELASHNASPTKSARRGDASTPLPTSRERLASCSESAAFWADELPRYANFQQSKADWWAIAAGVLAAATSLSVFPALDSSSGNGTKLLVAIPAFLAAVLAVVPRIKNYAEMAGTAVDLRLTGDRPTPVDL
jgi:hypothetical protein